MTTIKYQVAVISTFIWLGFVFAISFMEAWLKFKAPGITLPLGLGIGRLVFSALNKVEWVLAISIIANILLAKGKIFTLINLFYFSPLMILFLQTVWLLPALDARAEMIIKMHTPAPTNHHFFYIGIEAIKVICLAIFGIRLLNNMQLR